MKLKRVFYATFAVMTAAVGCVSAPKVGTKETSFTSGQREGGASMTQIELQEELQRFSSQFIERVVDAASSNLTSESSRQKQVEMRLVLNYSSSALDIASAPYPEVNLLDMMAFSYLSEDVLRRYWVRRVLGDSGRPLIEAFEDSRRDLNGIAARVMTPQQVTTVRRLVREWESANPNQVHVEWVRLSEFSSQAGKVARNWSEETKGLFAAIKSTISSVDQTLLMGNRALFLANRLPFMIRLQARLGSQEIATDLLSTIGGGRSLVSDLKGTRPLVSELGALTINANELVKRLGPLVQDLQNGVLNDKRGELTNKLLISERIVDKSSQLLERFDKSTWTLARLAMLVGASWATFFWGGYALAKRSGLRHRRRPSGHSEPAYT